MPGATDYAFAAGMWNVDEPLARARAFAAAGSIVGIPGQLFVAGGGAGTTILKSLEKRT